ncbi:hypothetical protein OSTOST_06611 [Ostertagia ostertagi]
MYYENACIPVADNVVSALYGWGFGMKRQAISRTISTLKDNKVTLSNIPEFDELARLRDGRLFVQEQDPQLHIYYSEEAVEKKKMKTACKRMNTDLTTNGEK